MKTPLHIARKNQKYILIMHLNDLCTKETHKERPFSAMLQIVIALRIILKQELKRVISVSR